MASTENGSNISQQIIRAEHSPNTEPNQWWHKTVQKWQQLGNPHKRDAKNRELAIYASCLKNAGMYDTLSKLLSPTLGRTKAIQSEAIKTLAIIAHRPNAYKAAKWFQVKQTLIALNPFSIDGSNYNTLLLLSHILNDKSFNFNALKLRCNALELIGNVCNQNSEVCLEMTKQFSFISKILKILNDSHLFALTLNKTEKSEKNKNKMSEIGLLTFVASEERVWQSLQYRSENVSCPIWCGRNT